MINMMVIVIHTLIGSLGDDDDADDDDDDSHDDNRSNTHNSHNGTIDNLGYATKARSLMQHAPLGRTIISTRQHLSNQ